MATELTGSRIVALIPARGGSRSIPLKNIKLLAGRPLIHWVIDAASGCTEIDRVYVSTDDARIAAAVADHPAGNVEVIGRSPATATDTASTESAMLEFADRVAFDHVVLVQATSPLLESRHLSEGIRRYVERGADSLVSVVRQKRFLWTESADGTASPVNYDPARRPRRQEATGFLVENGAFYITGRDALIRSGCRLAGRIVLYEMPEETYLELDEPADWSALEARLRERGMPGAIRERAARIRLVLTDSDGVLTDGGMYYDDDGHELKKFNTRDGKGIERLRAAGVEVGIVSGEKTPILERRARKLGVTHLLQGVTDKLPAVIALGKRLGVSAPEIAFIGDDVNDLDVLSHVGLSAAPADARPEILARVDVVCRARGGRGCVRELAELVLSARSGSDATAPIDEADRTST